LSKDEHLAQDVLVEGMSSSLRMYLSKDEGRSA
jgi:hypothetical protein